MSLTCEDILEAMAQNLGFDMSPFKDQKGFSIVYKNDFVVTIEPCSEREGFYHIYSPVCDIPPEPQDREDLYTMLMRGHLFGYASHNNYFGIDRKRGKVFFVQVGQRCRHEGCGRSEAENTTVFSSGRVLA